MALDLNAILTDVTHEVIDSLTVSTENNANTTDTKNSDSYSSTPFDEDEDEDEDEDDDIDDINEMDLNAIISKCANRYAAACGGSSMNQIEPISTEKIETIHETSTEKEPFVPISKSASTPMSTSKPNFKPVPTPMPTSKPTSKPAPTPMPTSKPNFKPAPTPKSPPPPTPSDTKCPTPEIDTRLVLKEALLEKFIKSNGSDVDSVDFMTDLTVDLFIPLVKQYFGSLSLITHVKVTDTYNVMLNHRMFKPKIENPTLLETLPLIYQEYIMEGKWAGVIDLGVLFSELPSLSRIIISDEDFAEDTVRFALGLGRDSEWTLLFEDTRRKNPLFPYLRSIKIGNRTYTVETYLKEKKEAMESLLQEQQNKSLSSRILNKLAVKRATENIQKSHEEESLFSSIRRMCNNFLFPDDETGSPIAKAIAPHVRDIVGSGALVLGAKAVVTASLAFGGWGLAFGGLVAAKTIKRMVNNRPNQNAISGKSYAPLPDNSYTSTTATSKSRNTNKSKSKNNADEPIIVDTTGQVVQ